MTVMRSASRGPSLWLVSVVAAVRNNDPWTARDRLREKALPAARMTGDTNVMWTVFGPVNVGLHAVSVEMEMGEAGEALRLFAATDVLGWGRGRKQLHTRAPP